MSKAYRVRQFLGALRAELGLWRPPDLSAHLSEGELSLFQRMSRADQRHAVAVWQALRAAGERDPWLLRAALLHDVGKAESGLGLWHRVAFVLLSALWPGLLARLAKGGGGWREGFRVLQHHAERGAQLACDAGASPLVVALIRNHHATGKGESDPEVAWRMAALRRADGAK